jgi:hypothetical protein
MALKKRFQESVLQTGTEEMEVDRTGSHLSLKQIEFRLENLYRIPVKSISFCPLVFGTYLASPIESVYENMHQAALSLLARTVYAYFAELNVIPESTFRYRSDFSIP